MVPPLPTLGWAEAKALTLLLFPFYEPKSSLRFTNFHNVSRYGNQWRFPKALPMLFQRDLERGPLRDADYVYGPEPLDALFFRREVQLLR